MKNQKGITLISLVITIIVLIILAGVAISMTLGENGIFTKAQEAKKMQAIATAKEQIGTEILAAQIEAMENNEELEQSEVEEIVSKYGTLQSDGDTIILNDTEYEVSLREIYNTMAEVETDGDSTTELAQLKALLSQTTVTEDKILKDYKAYKDGQLITGSMENYAGETQDATMTSDDTYTYLSIPNNGYYTTESKLRISNSNIGTQELLNNSYALNLIQFSNSQSQYWTTLPCENYNNVEITYEGKDRTITVYAPNKTTVLGTITSSTTSVVVDVSEYTHVHVVASKGTPTVYFKFVD